jgi:DNA polymerase phi
VQLLGALEQFQAQHVPAELPSPDEDEESGEDSKLDVMNAQDVAYAIRRLVRGLASPRESSRLGFAVALTEVRTQYASSQCCSSDRISHLSFYPGSTP